MKLLIVIMSLLIAGTALGHDGGHGPKLSGNKNESAVISASDVKLGTKAKAIYAATLDTLSEDEVGVSLKSTGGGAEPDLSKFKDIAKGTLISTSIRKKSAPKTFALKRVTEN